MTLYMIGLGLANAKDISVRGLETIKLCDEVYLEYYTSLLQNSVSELEEFFGKKIIKAPRDLVEKEADSMLDKAKDKNVAFLVVGDPFCATTHIDLRLRAKEKGIAVKVIHNASIVSAIGVLGLEVYKFGKTTSIPFHHAQVKAPVEVYENNQKMGLHTLFLLDLDPVEGKFLTIAEACEYLTKEIPKETVGVGVARLGAEDQLIKTGSLEELGSFDFGKPPFCLVLPGKLHFVEEEALSLWKE